MGSAMGTSGVPNARGSRSSARYDAAKGVTIDLLAADAVQHLGDQLWREASHLIDPLPH